MFFLNAFWVFNGPFRALTRVTSAALNRLMASRRILPAHLGFPLVQSYFLGKKSKNLSRWLEAPRQEFRDPCSMLPNLKIQETVITLSLCKHLRKKYSPKGEWFWKKTLYYTKASAKGNSPNQLSKLTYPTFPTVCRN